MLEYRHVYLLLWANIRSDVQYGPVFDKCQDGW